MKKVTFIKENKTEKNGLKHLTLLPAWQHHLSSIL